MKCLYTIFGVKHLIQDMRIVANDLETIRSESRRSVSGMRFRSKLPTDPFAYNPGHAAQVIAYFALKAKDRAISVLKAIKLVYLADRASIERWGHPILFEPRVALKHGPVNDLTLDYVNGKRIDEEWSSTLLAREEGSNEIWLADGIDFEDLDLLSDADIIVLDEVWKRFGFMHPITLRNWTHKEGNVPEWSDPGEKGRVPIKLVDIMKSLGFPDPEAAAAELEDGPSHEKGRSS